MKNKDITDKILGAAIRVHRVLGPGLLESVYETCLAFELQQAGLGVRRQIALPVHYGGIALDAGFTIDLIINELVIVELKAVDKLNPIHEAQLMTYLRLSGLDTGLLINFNVLRLMDDVIRRVL
ncbi:MAG: GxxExxY protein [Phycisphaerales bacterium]|nr:GxxExxY protein [Phycisphaerales bacterium]